MTIAQRVLDLKYEDNNNKTWRLDDVIKNTNIAYTRLSGPCMAIHVSDRIVMHCAFALTIRIPHIFSNS